LSCGERSVLKDVNRVPESLQREALCIFVPSDLCASACDGNLVPHLDEPFETAKV